MSVCVWTAVGNPHLASRHLEGVRQAQNDIEKLYRSCSPRGHLGREAVASI